MKISTLLIFISAFNLLAGSGYSQGKDISLKLTNVYTIENVISEIEKTTDFVFIYNEDVVSTLKKEAKVDVNNQSLDEILNQLIEGTDLAYSVSSKQVTLYKDEIKKEQKNISLTLTGQQQQKTITGVVTDEQGFPLPGVSVIVKGTTVGTVTNPDGGFTLSVPSNAETLQFSFMGMKVQEVSMDARVAFTVLMVEEMIRMDEVVVVGYGTQKKSDITGSVSSMPKERLEIVPNLNIAQAIQGSVPGVSILTSDAGAAPNESFMIRGRNSILADNSPLIVVDGVPYDGNIMDINPNDVESIEILKDASSAAIYGSRGSNGVILVSTKTGSVGKAKLLYDGKFSMQRYSNRLELFDGEEFYKAKQDAIENGGADPWTPTELNNYKNKNFTNFQDIAMRNGFSQQHSLSVSGANENVNYFISGNVLDVQGLVLNDDFLRLTGRANIDVNIQDWLTIGTRSSLSYKDQSGTPPEFSNFHYGLIYGNPLLNTYEEDGVTPTVFPWPENTSWRNPLRQFMYTNSDKSFQVITNNYVDIDVPFIPGLKNRVNTGIKKSYKKIKEYRGRDTYEGFEFGGEGLLLDLVDENIIVENILSYNTEIGKHNVFVTGVLSYEKNKMESVNIYANRFANDLLTWHGISQADNVQVETDFIETTLLSQMFRMNYGYDSRYLTTFTVRRDGFSGFGKDTKWGVFPSLAFAWNVHNEEFFTGGFINLLKPRISYGLNGNQAIEAYSTIERLIQRDNLSLGQTQPGFGPGSLANEDLGWENSSTLNVGLDFGVLENRITGDINIYNTQTSDLLLNRTISPIHGITRITQNIGKTKNQGIELGFHSRNIVKSDFIWSTQANISFLRNEIIELYGKDGGDDIANKWFVGYPISVNFDYVFDGIWQEYEADEAAKWGSKPGFVKLKDINNNGQIDPDDRQIIGQHDPKMIWGLINDFTYRNLSLSVFIHGVHGVKKPNLVNERYISSEINNNMVDHGWWKPDSPVNDMWSYMPYAYMMDGVNAKIFDDASFVRIKDVSLSYNIPSMSLQKIGLNNLKLYVTGRNLFTFTKWRHLDPELTSDYGIPLQREYVFGVNLGF